MRDSLTMLDHLLERMTITTPNKKMTSRTFLTPYNRVIGVNIHATRLYDRYRMMRRSN